MASVVSGIRSFRSSVADLPGKGTAANENARREMAEMLERAPGDVRVGAD